MPFRSRTSEPPTGSKRAAHYEAERTCRRDDILIAKEFGGGEFGGSLALGSLAPGWGWGGWGGGGGVDSLK